MSKQTELEAQGFKTYENEEIQVFWNPTLCQHAAECVKGNRAVFDPTRKPWVDLSAASGREIAGIIDRCPSGALQYELKSDAAQETINVVFEQEKNRSAAYDGSAQIGECEFRVSGDGWAIVHTGVRPAYEGRGIARQLVQKVIDEARTQKIKIVPLCPYAKKMMTEKPEYADVL